MFELQSFKKYDFSKSTLRVRKLSKFNDFFLFKILVCLHYCSGAAKGTKMKETCIFSRKTTFRIFWRFKLSSFKKSLVPCFLSILFLEG